MVSAKKIPEASLLFEFQSHISVAILVTSITKDFTSGTFFFKTGAVNSPISKNYCNLYSLISKLKSEVTITLASRKALEIMGTASMMTMLAPTFNVDLGYIVLNSGGINWFFMGMDVMSGFQRVMGPVEIWLSVMGVKGHIY